MNEPAPQENNDSQSGDQHPVSSSTTTDPPTGGPPGLRIWPAILLLILMWALRLVPGWIGEVSMPLMMVKLMGPAGIGLLLVLWWLLLSRARWTERFWGLLGLLLIVAVTTLVADKSVRGFGTIMFAVPWGITAFSLALIALSRMSPRRRTSIALLAALVGFGFWDTVRNDGIWGDFRTSFNWRWSPTAEDEYLEIVAKRSKPSKGDSGLEPDEFPAEPEWPGFRGPKRDGVQPGIALFEQWESQPLREVWRIRIGPGWSSFSVGGRRLFTQEQRGEDEVVICYDADTGGELWAHQYESRFWEAVGGAGPRATPTLSRGAVFALGAEGLLFRLDPTSGAEVWRRDLRADAGRKPPTWGFASSPLVLDNLVIVHAGGVDAKGVLAYDFATGEPRWTAPAGDHSYSSPQQTTIAGRNCVLMLTNQGLTIMDPASGAVLGRHQWPFEGYRVVQPMLVEGTSVLLGTAMGTGTQRVDLRLDGEQFSVEPRWTSRQMSPYYNDYVAHQGFLYGFDNNIFACVDLSTGKRKWKKGRYGNGQVLLLPEADQLLVLSETGDLVLLRATSAGLQELTRWKVLEGKTWNHPVLVGDRLYVRNGEEAACFEVPLL